MKKAWKWLWILIFGLATATGGWLLSERWRLETLHIQILVVMITVCTFAALTILLGKKNQLAVSAFIVNGFHLWFQYCHVVEYTTEAMRVLFGIELGLFIYILVLLFGGKYLDWLINYSKISEEDKKDVEEETEPVIDLDRWLVNANIFFAGACSMLLVFEVVQMLARMRVYSFVYILLASLVVCHAVTFGVRSPRAKK